MKKSMKYFLLIICAGMLRVASADISIPIHMTAKSGTGADIGTVTAKQTPHGVLFTPNLHGLPAGMHGFHVHQNASCDDSGMAAGGHLDPKQTGKHLGPYDTKGHLGDLPVLAVDKDGNATKPVLAPKLKLSDIKNHTLMIHAGGDNYSDTPEKLGGGGARIACGVIP